MKNDELQKLVHDLSNKLTLVDGKLKKATSLCDQDVVKLELEKACKSCSSSLEILFSMKKILGQENNG